MADLPTGTVTFLFTDIEGSDKHWEQRRQTMPDALARYDAILRDATNAHGGVVFRTVGDAFCTAFASAPAALGAALDAQRALCSELWGATGSLRVRMALHTGGVELRDADYHGQLLNRLTRLLGTGYGGQTLRQCGRCSEPRTIKRDHPPRRAQIRRHRLSCSNWHRMCDIYVLVFINASKDKGAACGLFINRRSEH